MTMAFFFNKKEQSTNILQINVFLNNLQIILQIILAKLGKKILA